MFQFTMHANQQIMLFSIFIIDAVKESSLPILENSILRCLSFKKLLAVSRFLFAN